MVCVMGAMVLGAAAAAADAGETVAFPSIGSRRELLVDTFLVGELDGVALRLEEPRPAETVLAFDRPWEGRYCGYVTVLRDGDLFRMYYRGLPEAGRDGSAREVTCYAESRDGVAWVKPNLGLFAVDGTRENNVVLAGAAPFSHNFAPFLDARPGVPDEERFKAIAGTQESGLVAFVSGDGLRWKKLRDAPVITAGAFDSQNVAFWSEAEGCYACYFRTWTAGFRSIGRATSSDFATWGAPVEMSFGETPREHLYTNQTLPYFRAPHIYIAVAARFMQGRRVLSPEAARSVGVEAGYAGDCSDAVLLSSRGGNRYERTFMEAFIRPGMGAGNWTSRSNYPARGIVGTGAGEMSLYVQRGYGQPAHSLQRLTLRLDGFVSIDAPYRGGEFVTKPFRFEGNRLLLNVATSAAGGVKVELQDPSGAPLSGHALAEADEIVGDLTDWPVTWKGKPDVGSLSGKPVRLRFAMRDADLYAFQFVR